MIKKFKNGNLSLKAEKFHFDGEIVNENFYHDDMFFADLYIEQGESCNFYLVDDNKGLAYRLGSYLLQNPLKYILDELSNGKTMKLYPIDKEEIETEMLFRYEDEEE